MEDCLKYYAAACQTDQPNPLNRAEMKRNTRRMLQMIEHAVVGYAPFMPVKLIVYKGFGHGLNKPQAARAAMEHNLEWFNRYVFGEGATTTPAGR